MVNIGFSWSSFLGIILAVAGASLYFMRSFRPSLARDHDIFFAAVGLLCGGILFFQGWRQDPILQFGQFLLTGSAIFFAFESIRLRGVVTQQAKRSTPIVDDDRPVSNAYQYRAELEELEPAEAPPERRRIPGTRDSRDSDDYDSEVPRRPSSRRSSSKRRPSSRRSSSKRRPPSSDRSSAPRNPDEWDDTDADWDSQSSRRRRPSASTRVQGSKRVQTDDEWDVEADWEEKPSRSRPSGSQPSSRSRRSRRPSQTSRAASARDSDTPPTHYVDYTPLDEEDEDDNGGSYDY